MRRLLYFEAGYCGMCKAVKASVIDPLVERGYDIEVVDCMAKPSLAERHRVKMLPTTVVLDEDGSVFSRYEGSVSIEFLEGVLAE